MAFCEKLRALRLGRLPALTQADLGNAIGVTQRKISFMETGVTEPSLNDLVQICRYFNVSADYLLDLPADTGYRVD